MTPEIKAKELFDKFYLVLFNSDTDKGQEILITTIAKQCALLEIEEIIELLGHFAYSNIMYDDFETGKITFLDDKLPETYWHKVKKAIENI